jgi:ABC-2 type transport system ATP-binding protein
VTNTATKALKLEGLTKIYGKKVKAVQNIDLEVEAGDFFALLGPNGAGKSTTIGIISSLVNKTAGKVSVFGYDLDTQKNDVKRCLGLVPQEINFNQFEKSIDVLTIHAGYHGIPHTQARERAEYCLKQLDLWDKRNTITRQLSGGMKRRLMIARALVHSPKLLILDEPTAGVDIEIRRSMWELMQQINEQGTTIILTTHYLEEAESMCRNIAIINHGRIVEHSDMTTLLSKLEVDSFILNLHDPINQLPEISGYQLNLSDSKTLIADVPRESDLNQLFLGLTHAGIRVRSMKNKTNRLEQLFMNLVDSAPAHV